MTRSAIKLVKRSIGGALIDIIRNDEITLEELQLRLPFYSMIIVGPGPGSPSNAQDIGIIKYLWRLPPDLLLPIFGVCLGFQSLAIEFGGNLQRLKTVKHGQISRLIHTQRNLYEGLSQVDVVRYHSLHVTIPDLRNGELDRLAWTDDKEDNGRVLMAIAHKSKPFWGVQYHPESVCTTHGLDVISRFWKLASRWPRVYPVAPLSKFIGFNPWPCVEGLSSMKAYLQDPPSLVSTQTVESFFVPIPLVFERLNDPEKDLNCALLDSAADPGRFSIIPCSLSRAQYLTYKVGERHILSQTQSGTKLIELGDFISIWEWLSSFMLDHRAVKGSSSSPFWGGLVGVFSYELGASSLLSQQPPYHKRFSEKRCDDMMFVFVERSVVVDTHTGVAYIQSLLPNDYGWIVNTRSLLQGIRDSYSHTSNERKHEEFPPVLVTQIERPEKSRYISQIMRAKSFLASGDSYELCLTSRTQIRLQAASTPKVSRKRSWTLYKSLRNRNRAPFSCYLRLGQTTMLGSSPERFLSFSRDGVCQLRPIKGTASKALIPSQEEAKCALSVPKEFAENLMIVDLIRHDLHGITGGGVSVPKLCSVEEYETVWQLVSVIEGKTNPGTCSLVLGASLPPGSMTGAPKKRSVEILNKLEEDKRGLYSGVCGYLDVGGGGDFSVIIRSCIQSSSSMSDHEEIWEVGAGGAITALSDPEAEWEEMLLKLRTVLSIFQENPSR